MQRKEREGYAEKGKGGVMEGGICREGRYAEKGG
jgi:hypothetical protein